MTGSVLIVIHGGWRRRPSRRSWRR
eukprot:COSAG01_NODE_25911_length_729_cov_1.552381_1_plen_24_part_10